MAIEDKRAYVQWKAWKTAKPCQTLPDASTSSLTKEDETTDDSELIFPAVNEGNKEIKPHKQSLETLSVKLDNYYAISFFV